MPRDYHDREHGCSVIAILQDCLLKPSWSCFVQDESDLVTIEFTFAWTFQSSQSVRFKLTFSPTHRRHWQIWVPIFNIRYVVLYQGRNEYWIYYHRSIASREAASISSLDFWQRPNCAIGVRRGVIPSTQEADSKLVNGYDHAWDWRWNRAGLDLVWYLGAVRHSNQD